MMCLSSVATDHDSTGAIAEQYGHVAACRRDIEPRRVNLRTDHQHVLEHAGANVRVRDRHAVDEARALLANVETRDLFQAELALHEHRRAGEIEVRRQRRVDDQVDVFRLQASSFDRLATRLRRELCTRLAGLDPVALFDAGPLDDPLVRRLHLRRELVIRHDARRDAHTDAENPRAIAHPT